MTTNTISPSTTPYAMYAAMYADDELDALTDDQYADLFNAAIASYSA